MLIGRDDDARANDVTSREIASAARDIVVDRLAEMVRTIIGERPQGPEFPARHVATDPAHALHAALRDLPRLGPPQSLLALDLLAEVGGADLPLWQSAVQATVRLEPYTDALKTMPEPHAWQAVRDLGALAAALPIIDADLGERHGGVDLDHGGHGAIRAAAAELSSRVPAGPAEQDVTLPAAAQAFPVRSLAELPHATAVLGQLVDRRGEQISALEIRAAARVIAQGTAIAARVLRAGRDELDLQPVANALDDAGSALTHLHATAMATLGEPRSAIRFLAGEISNQLRVLDALLDRVQRISDPAHREEALAGVQGVALRWMQQVPASVAALDDSLRASHHAHRLLARPDEADKHRALMWVATATMPGDAEPPALAHTATARRAVTRAHELVTARVIDPTVGAPARAAAAVADLQATTARRGPVAPPLLPRHPRIRTGRPRASDVASGRGRRRGVAGPPTDGRGAPPPAP
jgi:hypothetical protein